MIERKEGFNQVCMWPSTIVNPENVEEFEKFMLDEMKTRVQFLESVTTTADCNDPTTGGRIDAVFAVHQDDVMKFALPRLQMGIRWVEDVLDNEKHHNDMAGCPGYSIYPDHLPLYRTW